MGFTEPGCAGWFFLNEGVLDGFLLNRVCGLVFTEQWCSGWFVQNSVLADFYGTSVCLLVFTEPGRAGWFLLHLGVLAGLD